MPRIEASKTPRHMAMRSGQWRISWLVAVAAVALCMVTARADSNTLDGVTWTYEVTNGTATVTGANPSKGALSIPASLGGCPVTAMGEKAFAWCEGIESVSFPEGLSLIGEMAFCGCHGLTSVSLPDGVETIGPKAFGYCTNLVSVSPGSGLRTIAEEAFMDCYSLVACPLPDGLESIGTNAFGLCGSLTEVAIPGSVASIAPEAFFGCGSLERFAVAEGNRAYASEDGVLFSKDMQTLECFPSGKRGEWSVPEGTVKIGRYAFVYCERLESLSLPDSLMEIGDFAFFRVVGPTAFRIPDGVVRVGERAFYGCRNLKEVDIGAGARGITGETFEICLALKRFRVSEDNLELAERDGILVSRDGKTLLCFPAGRNGAVEIPAGVECIGNSAFHCCHDVESVAFPAGLRELGYNAFNHCYNLRTVYLPEGLERIGPRAFYLCEGLEEVAIPESVAAIGDHAFSSCKALLSVEIPPRLTEIQACAFDWCTSLEELEIPSAVTNIGNEAFAYCNALKTVTIPGTVSALGAGSFVNSTGLVSAVVGEGVERIGNSVFFGCEGLEWVVLPGSVESVGKYCFQNCWKLAMLFVPEAWQDTTMLADARVPSGCRIVYYDPTGGSKTTSTPVAVPQSWLVTNASAILCAKGGDYEAAANAVATNGVPVWGCYLAGLSVTNAESVFRVKSISFPDGKATVEWEPDLNEGGTKSNRTYRVEGLRTMTNKWNSAEPDSQFFRVWVGMPK